MTNRKARRNRIKANKARRELWHATSRIGRSWAQLGIERTWYDRQGRPMPSKWYLRRREDVRYIKVAYDVIGKTEISTVWLGQDHGVSLSNIPLIFETMIFGGGEDGFCERYSTEAEAVAGHKEAVRLVVGIEVQRSRPAIRLCDTTDIFPEGVQ
jgi:hypothetical protein